MITMMKKDRRVGGDNEDENDGDNADVDNNKMNVNEKTLLQITRMKSRYDIRQKIVNKLRK